MKEINASIETMGAISDFVLSNVTVNGWTMVLNKQIPQGVYIVEARVNASTYPAGYRALMVNGVGEEGYTAPSASIFALVLTRIIQGNTIVLHLYSTSSTTVNAKVTLMRIK